MNIQPDFKELLALLEKHQVEYMIVGGYAVAFHGYPRFTNDIDVFFENSDENINKIISALIEFGFSEVDIYFIGKEDLIKNKRSTPRTKDKVDAEEIS